MRHYELVTILSPILNPTEATEAWGQIKEFITTREGEIVREQSWGTRRLAYPIRQGSYNFLEGNYYLTNFATDTPFNIELETYLRLDERVLRSLVIAGGPPPPTPEPPVVQATTTVVADDSGSAENVVETPADDSSIAEDVVETPADDSSSSENVVETPADDVSVADVAEEEVSENTDEVSDSTETVNSESDATPDSEDEPSESGAAEPEEAPADEADTTVSEDA
ncbi:MAG: 30S ribosomal protein S6 [Chloroflexota bacterium]|nr:30S ribosomal protein S6 [Chloroflexota bacterium]